MSLRIPQALADDPQDLIWALQTAEALWGRGERADALYWLRRAEVLLSHDPVRAEALRDARARLEQQEADAAGAAATEPSATDEADDAIEIDVELDDELEEVELHSEPPPPARVPPPPPPPPRKPPPPPPRRMAASAPELSVPPELAPTEAPDAVVPAPPPEPAAMEGVSPEPEAAPAAPEASAPATEGEAAALTPEAAPSSEVEASLPEPEAASPSELEPAVSEAEATPSEPEAAAVEAERATPELEPASSEPEPASSEPASAAVEAERATPEPEPVASEPEPAVSEAEATPSEPASAAADPERATPELELAASEPEPAAVEAEATPSEPEPAVSEAEPVSPEPEVTESEPEPEVSVDVADEASASAVPSSQDVAPTIPPSAVDLEELALAQVTPTMPPPPVASSLAPSVRLDAPLLADLPEAALSTLGAEAQTRRLTFGDSLPAAALSYVRTGELAIGPQRATTFAATLRAGDVLTARGTLELALPLRILVRTSDAEVVSWSAPPVELALRNTPWVQDDLRRVMDRVLAVCGAALGPLGQRLDEAIYAEVMQHFDVRVLLEGEVLVEGGQPLPGCCIVGLGELLASDGEGFAAGSFVFAEGVLNAGAAPSTVRAGAGGALVLVASRARTHELLVTCPPLLEILAGM